MNLAMYTGLLSDIKQERLEDFVFFVLKILVTTKENHFGREY